MVVRFQTCYTEGTIRGSIWKNQQLPTVFLHDAINHKYWTAVRHYARYRSTTNNKLTFFQKVLVFYNGKQSFETCLFLLTQTVLICMAGSNRVQRSLAVKTLNHWTTCVQLTGHRSHLWGYDNDIVTKHDVETHDTSLAFYSSIHFS